MENKELTPEQRNELEIRQIEAYEKKVEQYGEDVDSWPDDEEEDRWEDNEVDAFEEQYDAEDQAEELQR